MIAGGRIELLPSTGQPSDGASWETKKAAWCTEDILRVARYTGSEAALAIESIYTPRPLLPERDWEILRSSLPVERAEWGRCIAARISSLAAALRMPIMASQFSSLAEQAVREKKTHAGYLEALLAA